jgi:hypothetical protein
MISFYKKIAEVFHGKKELSVFLYDYVLNSNAK